MGDRSICHMLVIKQEMEERTLILEAATYSIGRDRKNAIVLEDQAISRQHALLLRLPNSGGGYRFRLIDGNTAGKPSTNGIQVNGHRCASCDLQPDDVIILGGKVMVIYKVMPIPETKFLNYLNIDRADYSSIKMSPDNLKETVVSTEDEGSIALLALAAEERPSTHSLIPWQLF